jgi:hypothetical protein
LPTKFEGSRDGKMYVYISTGSCVRVSRPRACTSAFVVLRTPNPLMPGPRGCLMTPPLEFSLKVPLIEPITLTLEGRLGTGGMVPFPKLLPNRDPKPPGERRDGEAMVA